MAGGGSFKEDSMAEKDRNQRMKEITQRLEQGVKEIFTSEMYMEYLKKLYKCKEKILDRVKQV